MIGKHTTNEPVINMKNFFSLDEDASEHPANEGEPSLAPAGWKVPLDLDAFPSSKAIGEAPEKRGNHAKAPSQRKPDGDHAAAKGSPIDPSSMPAEPSPHPSMLDEPSRADAPSEPDKGFTRSSLRSSVERAEEMSAVLAEAMVELSRKTESAQAIVRSIDEVANEAITRVESSVRKSFETVPQGAASGSFDTREMQKLEEKLADMLAEEYKRYTQALAFATTPQSSGIDFDNSELWTALTSYVSEKIDYLDSELEKKIAQHAALSADPSEGAEDKKSLEERFCMLEKQYRKSRTSTVAVGTGLFVSLAAIAVSLGSGLSFQQMISAIMGG